MKFKYKSLFFISLLIILSVSIGMVSASSDITVDDVASDDVASDDVSTLAIDQVDNNTISGVESSLDDVKDSPASLGSGTGTFEDIQKMVDSAKCGGVVNLKNITYYSTGNGIKISKSLTINGNGATLDAKGLSYIIWGKTSNINLKNINFVNAFEDTYGGAIYNVNNVVNCVFVDNYAKYGGAIYLVNTVVNCKFENNDAGDSGGAVCCCDKVSGCTFINNCAEVYGGAVDDCTIIEKCTFKDNYVVKATGAGGAICGGIAIDCIFEGNSEPATYTTTVLNNVTGKLTLKQTGSYYGSKTITVTLTDANTNVALPYQTVVVKFSNGKSVTLTTNSKGIATYNVPFVPGTYTASASVNSFSTSSVKLTNIKILKTPITITPTKLSTTYASGKYFQIKVINSKNKKAVSGVKLKLKIYTGKKYKTVTVKTNANGIAKYSASKLSIGTHKVIITNALSYVTGAKKSSSIKISKAKYNIIAPTSTNVYKKAGSFRITVKNKASGKVLSGVKLTVKIFTGKKYKTYSVKTNSKGVATISTKSLSKGTHKVVISAKATGKYNSAKKSSSIKILNGIPTQIGYTTMLTLYAWGSPSSISFNVVLTDSYGNNLIKPVTLTHSNGVTVTGYSGSTIGGLPAVVGDVIFKFKGDSKYLPSTFTLHLT